MGADIHLGIEIRDADGSWERAEQLVVDPYLKLGYTTCRHCGGIIAWDGEFRGEGEWKHYPERHRRREGDPDGEVGILACPAGEPDGIEEQVIGAVGTVAAVDEQQYLTTENWYSNRNYELFSVLADVRRYGDEPLCIDQPRGLPEDCSQSFWEYSEEYGVDGHSHTYFTVRELLAFDWDQTVHLSAMVSDVWQQDYTWPRYGNDRQEFKQGDLGAARVIQDIANTTGKFPWEICSSRCQWTNGENHQAIEWNERVIYAVGDEWFRVLRRLTRLALEEAESLDDVRIVMFFDN